MMKQWSSDKSYGIGHRVGESVTAWRAFAEALYAANPDIPLPPMHHVSRMAIFVEPGQSPTVSIEVIGLKMPLPPGSAPMVGNDVD